MERNNFVFLVLGAVFVISLSLIKYSFNFLIGVIGSIFLMYFYYELTLSPEEKARRKEIRERREAERRHLEFVKKEARARAEGESYGKRIGYERAKEDISWNKRPISTGFSQSPVMDMVLGRPQKRKRRK